MGIYIGTLLLIFVLGVLDLMLKLSDLQRKYLMFLLYVVLVVQIGLRWETGTDWNPYLDNFETSDNYGVVLLNSLVGFEIGYGTAVFIVKKIFNNYSVFLFLHAVIFYWGIFRTAKKYSPYFFISLMFFYATTLGVVGSNRQLLAIIICLWGLDFIFEKKVFKFFITIAVASLFHTTALIFGVYYFLNRNFKTVTVFSILILSFIIGKTGLPLLLFSKFGGLIGEVASSKATFYSENNSSSGENLGLSVFGLVKRIVFVMIFAYNYAFLNKKLIYYKLLYNGYVFGLVIYFLFASSLLILINRGSLYFNIMESLLISCQFLVFYKRLDKSYIYFILLLISIIFLFQSISAYSDLFDPYKGVFYNVDFVREMY